jgi:predicted DNA binding protein
MTNTIEKRQQKEKQLIVEHLKKFPIIEVACSKSGVGRSTFYRWRKEDTEFAKLVDNAIIEGVKFINDMAESQLLTAIKEGNMSAIFYWLNHRHSAYGNKIEITTNDKLKDNPLTEEQKKAVEIALGIIDKEGGDKK